MVDPSPDTNSKLYQNKKNLKFYNKLLTLLQVSYSQEQTLDTKELWYNFWEPETKSSP